MYLAFVGAGTSKAVNVGKRTAGRGTAEGGTFRGEASGRPVLLVAGVSKSEGLLSAARQGRFLRQGEIATERDNCKASLNGLADLLDLEILEL